MNLRPISPRGCTISKGGIVGYRGKGDIVRGMVKGGLLSGFRGLLRFEFG